MKINTNLFGVVCKRNGRWSHSPYLWALDASKENIEDFMNKSRPVVRRAMKVVRVALEDDNPMYKLTYRKKNGEVNNYLINEILEQDGQYLLTQVKDKGFRRFLSNRIVKMVRV